MVQISNEAKTHREETIKEILALPLFDSPCPEWAQWVVIGLNKGLREIGGDVNKTLDQPFLAKCLEAVMLAKNSAVLKGNDMDEAFADRCGKVLSVIAHEELGIIHSTESMEHKYSAHVKARGAAR